MFRERINDIFTVERFIDFGLEMQNYKTHGGGGGGGGGVSSH